MAVPVFGTKEEAYAEGRKAGEKASAGDFWRAMAESCMGWARRSYPASAEIDYWDELARIEKERMAADLDLTKFPECRGLREVVEAEHKGFTDGCGDERMTAYQFNWYWYISRRLNTRFVAAQAPKGKCTGVWIRDGVEGPLQGCNIDDIRRPFEAEQFAPPEEGPDGEPVKGIKCIDGVSAAVLCDEEPEDIFPVDPVAVMPREIAALPEFVSFMERYRDFFGPGNSLWIDKELNSVAFEKSNRRLGVRYAEDGTSAVTACCYLTPEMNAFKKERDRISIEARGWTEDCPDYVYWQGCEQRYRRLLKLAKEETDRGATLRGMANIMLDHEVPFPERICLAGESGHPEGTDANWTLMSWSSVMFGATRRTLFWNIEGNTPIYGTKPYLIPGEGVEMREEWKRGTRLE